MASLKDLLPDADALLSLEPEELAGYVLEYLNGLAADDGRLNRHNFHLPQTVRDYPIDRQQQVLDALMEAWVWLEHEGLLIPTRDEWRRISRRGRALRTRADVDAFRNCTARWPSPPTRTTATRSVGRTPYCTMGVNTVAPAHTAVRRARR